ncbi:MAG: nucleotidyl transferase AbiEii/AbiGii toxin family protein [Egibacteraceae bacterium]
MSTQPSRSTVSGRVYLDLQRRAREERKPTQELLVRYVHERFLMRLSRSPHRHRLVLKGGMLLTVFDVRRATADLDMLARGLDNQTATVTRLVTDIAALDLDLDDGVGFDIHSIRAEVTRQDDLYPGVRVHVPTHIATARIPLKLDVNFGDPVTPAPTEILYPALLHQPFSLWGYPLVTVLAEKIETMVRRGDANTRERDFADVWLLTRVHAVSADDLATAIAATAEHRGTAMTPLAEALSTLPQRRQRAWSAFVRRAGLELLPQTFVKVVDDIRLFADPLLAGQVPGRRWNPSGHSWDLTPGI